MPAIHVRTNSEPLAGTAPTVDTKRMPSSSDSAQSSPGGMSPESPWAFDDTVIPPSHPARTLVLCFDGTGDQFDADNSNIVRLFSMLKKDDRNQQMVYYQAGIGTYTIPEIATPMMAKISKAIDEAIANHLNAHVMSGYEFLMENYQAGDRICIFGFSRGAYTARALAGMVHKVGLLPAGNHQQVAFAYKMFTREDDDGWKQSTAFKKAFSVDVEIEFLGVWETVASVGLIPRRLPFTTSNTAVRYFRHAIALDEHRAKFKANHWRFSPPEVHDLGTKRGEMARSNHRPHPHEHHHGKKVPRAHLERDYDNGPCITDVKEIWFAGCHCDVGGGSVKNDTRYSLARIPLRWMIRQCFETNTGIQFHRGAFRDVGLDPNSLYPIVQPRPPPIYATQAVVQEAIRHATEPTNGTLVDASALAPGPAPGEPFLSEEDEDLRDALSPIYDQLSISKSWWILEVLPLKHKVQDKDDGSWYSEYAFNLGKGRNIPRQHKAGVKVHRSVKIRMEAEELVGGRYKPKAELTVEPTWID